LIAEDNLINQTVALKILEKLGFSCDVVDNGSLAVEAASRRRYSLILMDWHMPVMDGIEATIAIRKQEPQGSRIPMVAFTAACNAPGSEMLFAAGLDDCILKPAVLADFRAMLQKWLPEVLRDDPSD